MRAFEADVCLLVEGCYPYVTGGVSSWIEWLIRGNPDIRFGVIPILAKREDRPKKYTLPSNVVCYQELYLNSEVASPFWTQRGKTDKRGERLAQELVALLDGGGLEVFAEIEALLNRSASPLTMQDLLASGLSWTAVCATYRRMMPQASFLHFFWAWRSLFGGLFSILKFNIPAARVYHSISTGYAGLLAARAGLDTGRPVLLTEHGIYTNERRIEILMAEWISDTIDKGLSLQDDRVDLRDMWMRAFDAYARVCYDACSTILTLYEDNQRLQLALGADASRLAVAANGIDVARFATIEPVETGAPTVALIGRVVPIKDVKTYIQAIGIARHRVADLKAFVLGATDEDPAYFAECQELVSELGLADVMTFTGPVRITDFLPRVHVVALTSLSEAQPLVLLEAGAAGIPCVATDVGSCREIIEGRSTERPRLGPGGRVTELVNPEQIGTAIADLLVNRQLRDDLGRTLQSRVRAYYDSEQALAAYRTVYATSMRAATKPPLPSVLRWQA
jgi:glycosyltransferase involved in cell wall biosynthesis